MPKRKGKPIMLYVDEKEWSWLKSQATKHSGGVITRYVRKIVLAPFWNKIVEGICVPK